MEFLFVLLAAGCVFGLCYLVDRAFNKIFRSKAQHRSGLAVRASKRYGIFGVILTVLGILGVCTRITDGPVLLVSGILVALMGVGLSGYYLTFGVSTTRKVSWCPGLASRTVHTVIRRFWDRSCT